MHRAIEINCPNDKLNLIFLFFSGCSAVSATLLHDAVMTPAEGNVFHQIPIKTLSSSPFLTFFQS
jgi:hypothetical protein